MKQFITRTLAFLLLTCIAFGAWAQDSSQVKLTYTSERLNDKEVLLTIKAVVVGEGKKLYSINKPSEESVNSTVEFDSAVKKFFKEPLVEKGNVKTEKDADLAVDVKYVTDSLVWQQKVELADNVTKAFDGKVSYFIKDGKEFKSGETEFSITSKKVGGEKEEKAAAAKTGTTTGTEEEEEPKSLWEFFLVGLVAGIGAFIMPCIYAMVPVTVSFFTKRSTSRAAGIKNALIYSLSIIVIYTLVGFLITLIFGPGALNEMASSAVFNIFVFVMFVIFGISFLGAFEITLPASWSNKIDSKSNFGSMSGLFFMALTLVIVSFSCTVPFIGGLTAYTAKGGSMMAPLVGFFGFSFALAMPFALFAFFPALLNKLGKSGGWLNTIKVALGFIELALALKFLSSADLAYHWGILDREVYLSLWIVIFGLLGLYLLGKLRFHHDNDLPLNDYGKPYLTVTRLFFAISALAFTVFLIPGLWGAPLKGLSAWLPEMKTQDFNLAEARTANVSYTNANGEEDKNRVRPVKYTDFLKSEIPGVDAFFDYKEALEASKKMNKPLMVDFTGHSCANCRKMEQEVLNDPEVMKRLSKDFVVVSLYQDDKFRLPDEERFESKHGLGTIKDIGNLNKEISLEMVNSLAQPLYVFVDTDGTVIKNAGGYKADIPRFVKILDDVLAEFKAKHK